MFEHSAKVPRQYKIAANIFQKVSTEGGSVKTLLYDNKLRHFRTNVLYALITETIRHAADIDKIFESTSILKNEPRLDPWLAKVLTTEILFGKKSFPGKSKPEQTILSYKEQFEKFIAQHQGILKEQVVHRPRYVRINTNLFTTSDAIRAFQDEGYRFIRCTSGSYDDYLHQIKNLDEYDFIQDYHIKYVFVFAPGTKLHEHELYMSNKIILQDKATALAVYLLAPPPGSVVLDMCAAPGMKTTQMAAYMKNEGKIYAIERNESRYKTLCDFVERTGSKCVETINKDTLEIKKGEFDDVEYILLDPSCSGSGMELCVHNYIEDTRLTKLTSLQEKFLKHAMNSFPNAKKIIYSTCSVFSEENERVVTNAVKTSRSKWRVQDVKQLMKDQWNNFGSTMYGSIGARCLYARANTDLTIGFFLAVLERDPKDCIKQKSNEKLKNNKHSDGNEDFGQVETDWNEDRKLNKITQAIDENIENLQNTIPSKKKKRKLTVKIEEGDLTIEDKNNLDDEYTRTCEESKQNDVIMKKKKKKYVQSSEANNECTSTSSEESKQNDVIMKKNKKKYVQSSEVNDACTPKCSEESTKNDVTMKKKKKKYVQSSEVNNEYTPTCSENSKQNDVIMKTKKKKYVQSSEVNHENFKLGINQRNYNLDLYENEGLDPDADKKEDEHEQTIDTYREGFEKEYEEVKNNKKKKKKTHVHSIEEQNVETNLNELSSDTKHRTKLKIKKSRKIITVTDNSDIDSILENNSTEILPKKKKTT